VFSKFLNFVLVIKVTDEIMYMKILFVEKLGTLTYDLGCP